MYIYLNSIVYTLNLTVDLKIKCLAFTCFHYLIACTGQSFTTDENVHSFDIQAVACYFSTASIDIAADEAKVSFHPELCN